MNAIVDNYEDDNLPPVVKMYVDGGTKYPDITTFFQAKGWACHTNTKGKSSWYSGVFTYYWYCVKAAAV